MKQINKIRVADRLLNALHWKARISPDVWVERYFKLEKGSAVGGGSTYNFDWAPHLRLPFQAFGFDNIYELSMMVGSQGGKTTLLMGTLNYHIDRVGGTVLYFLPNDNLVPYTASDRVLPSIKACINNESLLAEMKTRKLRENTKNIRTTTTLIRILGAASPTNRKSAPAGLLYLDEIAEMENYEVAEIEERAKTFEQFGGKIVKVSTPIQENDPIVRSRKFAECQMDYKLKCPHCGKLQKDDFIKQIRYPKRDEVTYPDDLTDEEDRDVYYRTVATRNAAYECVQCKKQMSESEFDEAVINGKWEAKRGDIHTAKSVNFHASSMVSRFVTLSKMTEEYLKAEGSDISLDKFYSGWLAEIYKPEEQKTNAEELKALVGNSKRYAIPDNTIGLFTAVDVQKDHYWYVTRAVTIDMALVDIDYGRIETEHDLEQLALRTYDGHFVEAIAIDSGYDTQRIYDLCDYLNHLHENEDPSIQRAFKERSGVPINAIPVRGSSRPMTVISQISSIEKDLDGKPYADSMKLHVINTMIQKDTHFAYIRRSLDKEYKGKRRLSFHKDAEETIFNQYTSEYKTEVIDKRGRISYEYVPIKSHPDNHLLDCSVYILYLIDKFDVRFRKPEFVLPSITPIVETIKVNAAPTPQTERPDWMDEY